MKGVMFCWLCLFVALTSCSKKENGSAIDSGTTGNGGNGSCSETLSAPYFFTLTGNGAVKNYGSCSKVVVSLDTFSAANLYQWHFTIYGGFSSSSVSDVFIVNGLKIGAITSSNGSLQYLLGSYTDVSSNGVAVVGGTHQIVSTANPLKPVVYGTDNATGTQHKSSFLLTITSIDAVAVKGNFSGNIFSADGSASEVITNGSFYLPVKN